MTTTELTTLKKALTLADPTNLPDALRKVDLGAMLDVQEYDTGTITASATVTLPGGALIVQSARVVTSGTAASVGTYLVGDAGSTPIVPPGGASAAVGIASLNALGTIVTFPNTITRAVFRYIKQPATALSSAFPNLP